MTWLDSGGHTSKVKVTAGRRGGVSIDVVAGASMSILMILWFNFSSKHFDDKLYSPQMVVTIYKYTIENNLTKNREKIKNTHINKWYVLN